MTGTMLDFILAFIKRAEIEGLCVTYKTEESILEDVSKQVEMEEGDGWLELRIFDDEHTYMVVGQWIEESGQYQIEFVSV